MSPNIDVANKRTQLFVFRGKEAVIKDGSQKPECASCFLDRIVLIWIDCSRELKLDSNISSRHVNTKDQVADILTRGVFHNMSQWNDLMQLVQISATPGDEAFVRSHSQPRPFSLPEALLLKVPPVSQKREVSWSTGISSESSRHTTPESDAFPCVYPPPTGKRS